MSVRLIAGLLVLMSACAAYDMDADDLDSETALSADVCACETPECLEEIVRDAYGCDICITWECETGTMHSCAMCEQDEPAAPGAVIYDAPPASTLGR